SACGCPPNASSLYVRRPSGIVGQAGIRSQLTRMTSVRPRESGRAEFKSLSNASCAGRSASKTRVNALMTRASIFFAKDFLQKSMDCRVKPGNGDLQFGAHAQASQRSKFARTKASSLRCG